jgi:hypothetical protein
VSSIIRADKWQNANGVAYNAVLQVVSTIKTDAFSTTSTSYTDITGLSVTITPRFNNSKVLIIASLNVGSTGASPITGLNLLRDSTAIYLGDAAGSRTRGSAAPRISSDSDTEETSIIFFDSPSTVSAVTYKIQMRTSSSTSFLNRTSLDSDVSGFVRTPSSITVMEIAQ